MEKEDLFVKEAGPLTLVNFHKAWSANFTQKFDIFLDTFSNLLIFHNEGYFVIWEEFRRSKVQQTGMPFTLHLRTSYKNLLSCAIHPTKTCLAL
jgi:hypothetical protein